MAFSLTATYNGEAFTLLRRWSLETAEVRTGDGKALTEIVRTYTMLVQYTGNTTATHRKTDLDQLRLKMDEPLQAFTLAQDGVTMISHAASDADVIGGPFARYSVPGDGVWKHGYNLPALLTVEVRLDPQGSGTLAQRERTQQTQSAEGLLARTISGELKVAKGGTGAAAACSARILAVAQPVGYTRTWTYETDHDDLLGTYSIVDTERGEDPPAGASSAQLTVSARASEGTEQWALAGTVTWPATAKPSEAAVDALISKWLPSDAVIAARDVRREVYANGLSFTITATRPYGKDGILAYQHRYGLQQRDNVRIRRSLSAEGPDVAQEWARPAIEVTESVTIRKGGGYAPFPGPSIDVAGIVFLDKSEDLGALVVGPTGDVVSGEITATYHYVVLNQVEVAEQADFAVVVVDPTAPPPDHPIVGQESQGQVA